MYISHSMHVSKDSIIAAEVIYMLQSPGRAAAAFRHLHVSPISQDKLQHSVLPRTLSNTLKGQALCLQILSQKGNYPAQLPWAPRTSANLPVA